MSVNNKKVICAMSGGIDSSVATALLKRANFNVIGVFMKFWSEPQSGSARINADKDADLYGYENRCCSQEAETRARKVASILKIPFYVFDFQKEFKKRIINYFLKEYKAGRTPNPCVICNKQIKFGLLLEKALKMDADYIATGHYAKTKSSRNLSNSWTAVHKISRLKLLKGKDKKKDQSYFIWQLNQKQLKRILFPIGNYTKPQVRKLAKKFKLPVLDVPESQEICFIQKTTNDFLKKHLSTKPGPIIEQIKCSKPGVEHKIIGKHQGLWFYTIGQRKGLNLPGGPFYVLYKDIKNNVLIVTKNENDLDKKELTCKNINWISHQEPKFPLRAKAKIRYQHSPASATLTYKLKNPDGSRPFLKKSGAYWAGLKTYKLTFEKPQRAITPGQSVVFYKRNEVLGGGIIID